MQWWVASAVWTVNFLTTNMRRMSTVKYHKALESYRCLKRIHTHTHTHTQTHRHTDTHTHTRTHKQGEKTVLCCECGRWFRREGDKTRHKCAAERRRPVCEQGGALQCEGCQRWFRSRGGLAVHRCMREEPGDDNSGIPEASKGRVECKECSRAFSQSSDLKRHKCLRERSKPVQEQRGALQCVTCMRWFKSAGGLSMHKSKIRGSNS